MACLDEQTIVAFIGAHMAPEEIGRVEAHAAGCDMCRELLSLAVLADLPPPGQTAAPDRAKLARGTSFGRYTVLGPVGRGAMGDVYAAYDPELDRKVALKILHARGDGPDGRNRNRLLREAKAIAKLRHPNVVVVHEAGSIDDRVFLAMEYVDGQTLAAWLAERPRSRKDILEVFTAAGRGLGAAHAAGLAHRDFKPQNVMVGSDGSVRVTDFGLAREIGAHDPAPDLSQAPPARIDEDVLQARTPALPITRTGEVVGTPLYMAPEQFKARPADARSDQFGFCVALYQALYGVHPFGAEKLGELIAAVSTGRVQPPPPRTAVPTWLRRVLVRGLNVDPALRWESIEALTAALARDPARRRRRWAAGLALAAGIVAVFAAARGPHATESLCRSGSARLAGVWEPDAASNDRSTRRAATRAAFIKTGVEGAVDTWNRAARLLDRYAGDWVHMYGDACTATHVRGEQSAEILDLRMSCLQDRLGSMKALSDVFVDANATVVENAVNAASGLPTLEGCADVKLLRAVIAPPDGAILRARVASLRADLARVRALHQAGQCHAATTTRRALIADADALGYAPLQAESLTVTLRQSGDCMNHIEAIRDAKRAVMVALGAHHGEVAAEAAILVALFEADRTADFSHARDWIDLATAIMQGMASEHPVLETWRLQALAVVYEKEHDLARALDSARGALSLVEKTQGREHVDYAIALMTVATILVDTVQLDDALTYYQTAAERAKALVGPDSTVLAMIEANRAETLNKLHRYDEARTAALVALRIWHRAGATGLYEGFALTNLGEALLGAGRPDEAAAEFEKALVLLNHDSTAVPEATRFGLARALWQSHGSQHRALTLARGARAGYQRFGDQARIAEVDAWLVAHKQRAD